MRCAVVTDVTSWEDNERLAAAALDAFGQIDVAFVNAGFGGKRSFKPDEADTVEHWRDMVLTNVLGAAYTVRATIPAILESQGHVLLTGSVAGRIAIPGQPLLEHEVGGDRHGPVAARRGHGHAACA